MQIPAKTREPAEMTTVALKAYARTAEAWGLTLKEAAGLADRAGRCRDSSCAETAPSAKGV